MRRHRAATGGDLFAEVVDAERSGPRVVAANEHWTAFVPAAARWPYEVQLFPTRRVPDIPALTDAERDAFVAVYLDVLGRFARRFDAPMPYIAAWNQAPVRRRARRLVAAPAAVLLLPRAREAEVPRRLGVGDGRVHHRHEPRGRRRAAARRRRGVSAEAAGPERLRRAVRRRRPRASGRRPAGST